MRTATQLSEEGTSRRIRAGGLDIHYHDIGEGEPLLLLHSYGPGATAWITFHKIVPALSERYRCILMDLPNFGRTGPVVYDENAHAFLARTALALLDALDIETASLIGNSVGGTTALVFAINYPERLRKLVVGSCAASTGGDPYAIANFPSEGIRVFFETVGDPTRENFKRFLSVHIDDDSLVTDELVDYMHKNHVSHLDHFEAMMSSSLEAHSNLRDLPRIKAPTLIVQGRFDRMISVEQALMILSYIPDSRLVVLNKCGHWPPYEKPEEYAAFVLTFLGVP